MYSQTNVSATGLVRSLDSAASSSQNSDRSALDPPARAAGVSVALNENALLSGEDVDCDVETDPLTKGTS